ncbi:DUF3240 domain-containing protein [Nitrogeniibacter mangrovi]|uniref:DUF3240 domain-containing protein n=1 Tax=Nitrogeniibacter mangrovi TaxID=2016596 RepID=A0A6C1B7L0_9RHOO|nr:DUF3240 family protein [Nitrogeniibacter mangrovi]QID19353.1 DUF3240 domain-containing protein [Nitrogeniibacter mangrovi]
MPDVLLTLVMPNDIAQHVEDLLLSHPDLVRGFTACQAEGHGASVPLVQPEELVSGHAPRTEIQTVGPEPSMRAVLELIHTHLPGANVFYWLQPVLAMGRL